ncbi:hypothetical protein ACUL41_17985 [Virgibacillus natechei]
MDPDSILNDDQLQKILDDQQVDGVEYKGENTYVISLEEEKVVAIKEYYSFMNYNWSIYTETAGFDID